MGDESWNEFVKAAAEVAFARMDLDAVIPAPSHPQEQ